MLLNNKEFWDKRSTFSLTFLAESMKIREYDESEIQPPLLLGIFTKLIDIIELDCAIASCNLHALPGWAKFSFPLLLWHFHLCTMLLNLKRCREKKLVSAFFTGLKTDIKQNKAAYAMGNYCHLELVHIIKWFEVILRTVACTINLLRWLNDDHE